MEGQTKLADGMICRIDGGVKPSWRRAWSVEPTERVRRPAPWLWLVAGALTRSRCRKFKGRPRDNKTIGSVQSRLRFPRSIDKVPTGDGGVHQATAPSTQLVGCDGDWPACRALSVGTDEKGQNQAGGRHGPLDRWKGQTKLAQGSFRWGLHWGDLGDHRQAAPNSRIHQGAGRWPSASPVPSIEGRTR
jgi:hypothetical protein